VEISYGRSNEEYRYWLCCFTKMMFGALEKNRQDEHI
jgi:hypothetical protein